MAKTVIQIAVIFAALLSWSASTQAGKIYRWVDDQGRVHYSNKPRGDSGGISAGGAGSEAAKAALSERRERQKAVAESLKAEREKRQATKEKQAGAKKKSASQCKDARDQLVFWKAGGRIYKTSKNGEKSYYSAKEIDAKARLWQKRVKKYC